MNGQRHRRVRLRDDSSWQCSSPTPSRLKAREFRAHAQEDVNEDEEVYTDGTSITNITVSGVKDRIAMFGAKPTTGTKPVPAVLRRFQAKAEEAGQTSFGSNNSDSSPQANGGPPKSAIKPKPVGPPSVPGKTATDQNQNVTNFSPNKRGSLNIPSAFQPTGSSSVLKDRKISIDEKSSAQNGVSPKPSPSNNNDSEPGKFDFRANLKSPGSRISGAPKKVEINPRQQIPSEETKAPPPPSVGTKSGVGNKTSTTSAGTPAKSPGFGSTTGAKSPGFSGTTATKSPGFGNKSGTTSPGFGNKTGTTSPGFGNKAGSSTPSFGNKTGTTVTKSPPTSAENKTVNKTDENKPPTPIEKKPSVSFSSGAGKKPADEKVPSFNKRITPLKTIVIRTDGKKFERLPKSSIITQELAPIKPLKPKNANVKEIIDEYKKAFDEFKYANEELYDDVGNFVKPDDEYYDDVGNIVDRRKSARTSTQSSNRPVSEIPDMTEEEELGSGGSAAVSVSAMSTSPSSAPSTQQDELYDDGMVVDDTEELYEPLPDEEMESGSGSVGDNSLMDKREKERLEKEAAERRKKEEQDRKAREKKEKQEQAKREKEEKAKQKERDKKEKEERELRKKLKLIGDEVVEAQGTVKDRQKGGRLDLAVSAGQNVEIIRMTDNPKGKWLVRDELGHLGYVDSSNITIDTSTIRQAMIECIVNPRPVDYIYKETALQIIDPPQIMDIGTDEMYEDLDGYQQDDEIYEECS